MSRRVMGGSASVSVYADCHLHEFDDLDVLAYAAQLVAKHRESTEPEAAGYAKDAWRSIDVQVDALAAALKAFPPPTDAFPYPPSKATTITSVADLRALPGYVFGDPGGPDH